MAPRPFTLRTEADTRMLYAFLRNNWPAMADAQTPLVVTAANEPNEGENT